MTKRLNPNKYFVTGHEYISDDGGRFVFGIPRNDAWTYRCLIDDDKNEIAHALDCRKCAAVKKPSVSDKLKARLDDEREFKQRMNTRLGWQEAAKKVLHPPEVQYPEIAECLTLAAVPMSDEEFFQLANAKGYIVHSIKAACEKQNWGWMVLNESPEKMVIEFRKIKEATQ